MWALYTLAIPSDVVTGTPREAKADPLAMGPLGAHDMEKATAVMGVASDVGSVVGADQWRRSLALFLDGMRATDRAPLTTLMLARATDCEKSCHGSSAQ